MSPLGKSTEKLYENFPKKNIYLALSSSLFSDSNLTAANQISSLFGFAWKANDNIERAAEISPY